MLEVIDLKLVGGRLKGEVTRMSALPDKPLQIHLYAPSKPAGLVALGGGVVYVTPADSTAPAARDARPEVLGRADDATNYRWPDTAHNGAGLALLVLPKGHTLIRPAPVPIAARVHDERLAVFWAPGGQALTWLMRPYDGDLGAEAARLNGDSPTGGRLTDQPGMVIVETEARVPPSRKWVLAAAGLAVAAVALAVGLWPFEEDQDRGLRGVVRQTEGPQAATAEYGKSYALVIGIDTYPGSERFRDLGYARGDAEGVAGFLDRAAFDEVITLYDDEATKQAIIGAMQNRFAPLLQSSDRVFVFYAGHGHTEPLGDKDWGYIVPYDGTDASASYISMEELQTLSKKMGRARHQLFVMDACHGGLLGTRGSAMDATRPDYIDQLMRRTARQVLTAGGADQEVVDGGPGGHSVFTGFLLEGVEKGLADLNGDGFIPFSELVTYLVPKATNSYQTPAYSNLPGHGLGEFVFQAPPAQGKDDAGAAERVEAPTESGQTTSPGG